MKSFVFCKPARVLVVQIMAINLILKLIKFCILEEFHLRLVRILKLIELILDMALMKLEYRLGKQKEIVGSVSWVENPSDLGCSCKNELAGAHQHCAETWFGINNNTWVLFNPFILLVFFYVSELMLKLCGYCVVVVFGNSLLTSTAYNM